MNDFAENSFDWIPFYCELADKLVQIRTNRQELIAFIEEIRAEGLKVTQLEDKDAAGNRFLLPEIDPFTFFAMFNRGIAAQERIRILARIKTRFGVSAPVPSRFDGIPVMNNQASWFFSYQEHRAYGDIDKLWDVFERALAPKPLENPAFAAAFDMALAVRGTSVNLTMGLFWIRPQTFLGLDKIMRGALNITLPKSGLDFDFYRKTVERVRAEHGSDFPRLSTNAWVESQREGGEPKGAVNNDLDYWMVGAFWDTDDPPDQTDRFRSEGVWENGYKDRYLDLVKAMKVGDRIAIKAVSTQKNDLPFDYSGKTASLMRIKVTGTILANHGDGRTVQVDWDSPLDPPRTWYFYTFRETV